MDVLGSSCRMMGAPHLVRSMTPTLLLLIICAFPLFFTILLYFARFNWRRRGKLGPRVLKLKQYLGMPLSILTHWIPDEAWFAVQQLDGMEFRFAGSKPAHWRVVHSDARNRSLRLELDYMHTLGSSSQTGCPRTLSCDATVTGGGMSAQIVLTFHASSAMDYRTVQHIIDRTKKALDVPGLIVV
jgi:hypothetical protein